MNNQNFKELLTKSWQMEKELIEFCHQTLKRIYGENGNIAISHFNDMVTQIDDYGCLQSLKYMDNLIKDHEQRIKEFDEAMK